MSTLHRLPRRARALAALALVGVLGTRASAQDNGPVIHPPDPTEQQLVELFNKVETRLREIDKLLSDAGAGDTRALKNVGPSGIDELLKQSKKSGEEALQDIDRILEIARNMQQSKSQGQGQPQQQSGQGDGKDPMQGQGETTQQREQTPSKPEQQDKQPGGKKPEDGKDKGKDKPGKKPDGESNPNDPKGSKQPAKNQQSGPPPGTPTDKSGANSDSHDRWGDLPERARDVFRSEGGHDMPVQYRDWIDAYYRRLNQKQP